jgi:hypothetical protein
MNYGPNKVLPERIITWMNYCLSEQLPESIVAWMHCCRDDLPPDRIAAGMTDRLNESQNACMSEWTSEWKNGFSDRDWLSGHLVRGACAQASGSGMDFHGGGDQTVDWLRDCPKCCCGQCCVGKRLTKDVAAFVQECNRSATVLCFPWGNWQSWQLGGVANKRIGIS